MGTFQVQTVETVHRTYTVDGADEAQARKRLRRHFEDPELLREGLVERRDGEKLVNRRITGATKVGEGVKAMPMDEPEKKG